MTITAFRITTTRWSDNAFDGEGSRRFPGRWNSRGTPMVYTSGSRALAMLEMLVHLESQEALLALYQLIPVQIPNDCIQRLGDDLPSDWRVYPASDTTRIMGDTWITQRSSAVLSVPSTWVPDEENYLINPVHPDFDRLVIGKAQPLDIDRRLVGKTGRRKD